MSPAELDTLTHELLFYNRPPRAEHTLLVRLQAVRIFLFKVIFATEVLLTLYFGLRLVKEFNKKVKLIFQSCGSKERP